MRYKLAIFDMDGTLVDSMRYWQLLGREYLASKGVTDIPEEVLEKTKPMTMTESSALFIETFGFPGTPEEVAAEINGMMEMHYRKDVPLKDGVAEYLKSLAECGVRMCVASATAEPLMQACLKRLGVLECFEFLLSCETVGAGKNRPDVYFAAAQRLGCRPEEAAVYEDALYAAKTAKQAGFYVVGIYDETAGRHWQELSQLADETIRSF